MASWSTTPNWEAPKFSFNAPNQAAEWQAFYTRALDFLEALDIDPDEEDQGKCAWHQIKMMFEGEDCQVLQTLTDSNTVTPEAQRTPALALRAIQSVIKEDVHFWHHHNQILSDLQQLPEEGVHALSNQICTIISKCQFSSDEVKEIMKIMVLQHVIKYHEARDWICLQDQNTLTYQSLLADCKQLEARCEQFHQAQAQGRAHLTSIMTTSSSKSSIHADMQSTPKQPCSRCGNTHQHGSCPAFNHKCFNCHNTGHFTALCRRPCNNRCPVNTPNKCRESRGRCQRSNRQRRLSRSPSRGRQTYRSTSHNSRYPSTSHNPSQDHHKRRSPHRGRCSPTPYRHQVNHIMSFNSSCNEGQLYTDRAPDGQRTFHTTLQLITKQGCRSLLVKVDPGTDVITIPLSPYTTLFPKHFSKDGHLKQNALRITASTQSSSWDISP